MNGVYRKDNGEIIIGQSLKAFIHNGAHFLIDLKVYKDGMIDCWGLVSLEEFIEKVRSGWVKASVPEGEEIRIYPLGDFKIKECTCYVTEQDLIKEVKDLLNELNQKPTSLDLCQKAYDKYNREPTEENRERLKRAYEQVPEHNRKYLGDTDTKDLPIRDSIYGA
ncbi:MAG: hypothetical protein N2645_13720 [Clostridia bacterium]|nr:hypothetical protein [Clostridia bacterium]